MTQNLDWTHTKVRIKDIRKLNKLYAIYTDVSELNADTTYGEAIGMLFVKDSIFEDRLKSYFLKDISKITREDILGKMWNFYLTKGYFVKVNENGELEIFQHDKNKWYVSYLEIDGELGTFSSVYKDKEIK